MQNRMPIGSILPQEVREKHMEIAHKFLVASRHWKLGTKAPKVKALRRKLAMFRTIPVPDTGVIYERAGTKYKVMPNGEWRRQGNRRHELRMLENVRKSF